MRINEILNVGSRMKRYRIEAGYTQKEMADRLGIPKSTYSNYENGHREPKKDILERLAKELNMNVHELIGTADEMRNFISELDEFTQKGIYLTNLVTTMPLDIEKRDFIFNKHVVYLSLLYEYLGIGTHKDIGSSTLEKILLSSELKSFLEYLMSKYSDESREGN